VHTHSLVRNFAFLGVFAGIWLALAIWDGFRDVMGEKTVAEIGEVKQENSVMTSQ
jgi:hypothetical protein